MSDQHEASVSEVEAAVRTFFNAWNERDFQGATAPFAPDAVVFDPDKIEGPDEIDAWAMRVFERSNEFSITTSEHQIQTRGPVAWVTARWLFERVDADSTNGYFSMVWVREAAGNCALKLFHISHLSESESN